MPEKQKNNKKVKGALLTFRHLWPYMWVKGRKDLQKRILWALFYLCLAKVILICVPYLFKYSTNLLQEKEEEGAFSFLEIMTPLLLVFIYNFARILQAGFNQLRDALFARVGQHAVRKLAYETFIHTHKLSLGFHLKKKIGGFSRVIERGTKGVESIVRYSILNTLPTILEFGLTGFVFWLSYGPIYFSILIATILCYILFTIYTSNWRISLHKSMTSFDNQANSQAIDSFVNYETVKYFSNEDHEAKRFDASMKKYEEAATKVWVSLGWLNFGQAIILGVGMSILMIMSAYQVIKGTQSLGDFVFINALLIQISFPLNFIGSIYRDVRQGLIDVEAMFHLLDEPFEVKDIECASELKIKKAAIAFKDVSFFYEKERPILKHISFNVPAGKTVALVGASGAGKSTISRLLFRFYDVKSGEILIDGQNIKNVTQKSLREAMGMVPQDTVLFNDSLYYNIKYGSPSATEKDIKEAARLAQISDFIETLPEKYDTIVGERGLKLSGGERQRIAIARTLLKKPPILILDEATSALDSKTEQEIQKALNVIRQGRTSLVIAHRLSTIVNADEILVLKNGEIFERGTHKELLLKNGLYASMWIRQKESHEAEEKLRLAKEKETLENSPEPKI